MRYTKAVLATVIFPFPALPMIFEMISGGVCSGDMQSRDENRVLLQIGLRKLENLCLFTLPLPSKYHQDAVVAVFADPKARQCPLI